MFFIRKSNYIGGESGEQSRVRIFLRVAIILGLLFIFAGPFVHIVYAGDSPDAENGETIPEEAAPQTETTTEDTSQDQNAQTEGVPTQSEQHIPTESGESNTADEILTDTHSAGETQTTSSVDHASDGGAVSNDAQSTALDKVELTEAEPPNVDAELTETSVEDDIAATEEEPVEFVDNSQSTTGVPDPYFFVNGDKHSFLPAGGDCTGAANCQVSTTPIQDALNAVSGGLTPDDNTIYIEGGIYEEDVTINEMSDLALQGAADGNPSALSGSVSVINSISITLRDFVFEGIVQVSDSTNVSIVGTEGDDEIEIGLEGTVENLSVEGVAGNDDITINIDAENSEVNVEGGTEDDTLTLDFSSGTAENNVVVYDGGEDYDELEVIGDGKSDGSYTPTQNRPDAGVMTSGSNTIDFVGIEPTEISKLPSYTFSTSGADDILTIDSPAKNKNRISGTSAGTAFEALTFSEITSFTIDTVSGGSDGNDTITLDSSGLVATGLKVFTVNTGNGTDTVDLNGPINLGDSGNLSITSGTISIGSRIEYKGTITLSARDGVTLKGATIVNENGDSKGLAIQIDADSDDDGTGKYSQDSNSSVDTVYTYVTQSAGAPLRTIVADGGDVTITAADIDLQGSLEAINLNLIPSKSDMNIGFGGKGTGTTFNLNTEELTTNIDVKGTLSVGCVGCSGDINIYANDLRGEDYSLNLHGGQTTFYGTLSLQGGGLAIKSSDRILDQRPVRSGAIIKAEYQQDCNGDDIYCKPLVKQFGLQLSSANGVGTQQQAIWVQTWYSDKTKNTDVYLIGGASASGGFFVRNKGAINIENDWGGFAPGTVSIFPGQSLNTGVFVWDGDITIGAFSPLRVSKAIRIGVGGDINLTAGSNPVASDPSDNLDIRATVEINCQGVQNCQGTVTLNAGEQINGANLVSAPGLVLNPCMEGGCEGGTGSRSGDNSGNPGGQLGNAPLGSVFGAITAFFGPAGPITPGGGSVPITGLVASIFSVNSGQSISLLDTGTTDEAVNLQLPGGGSATFRAGIDATVTLNAGADAVLPEALPPEVNALDTIEIVIDTTLSPEELGGILLSFGLPADTPIEDLFILQYIEGQGWVEVPLQLSPEGSIEGLAETGGVFVLAQRAEATSAGGNTGSENQGNGSAQAEAALSGNTNEPVTLQPSQGTQVNVTGGAGDAVTAVSQGSENLPADLPTGASFLNSLSIDVTQEGNGVSILPNGEGIEVFLDVPEGVAPEDVVILYWLDVLNGGQGGWQELTPEITPDGHVVIRTFFDGIFVLANQG